MNHSLTRGIVVGALALAIMTTALPTNVARAQTTNVQNQTIEQLIALIKQLQAQIAGQNTGSATTNLPTINLTRNLSQGMTGSDVQALQRFLNADPDTMVALSGAGSKGSETTYFGPATKAAVIKFQNKYRTQVLTPVGLSVGTGYVGASTRAHINQLALATPNTPTDTDTNSGTDNQGGSDVVIVPEEGDITITRGSEYTSTVELGSTEAVYSFNVKADDSAMTIERVDVRFDKRPWRYLESVTLYHEGEKVKTIKATESNFTEVGNEYRLRFSGLTEVVAKNKKESFEIEVTALDSLSSSRAADTLSLYIPDDGVRARDTAKITTSAPNGDLDTRTFDFRDTENDGSLVVSRSSDSPESGLLQVDANRTTENVPVMIATVRAKGNDIVLSELYVKVESSETTVSDVVRKLSIKHGGDVIATENVVKNGATPITGTDEDGNSYTIIAANEYYVYFEDLDAISIDEDDKTNITVLAEFQKADGSKYSSGSTVIFTLRHLLGENESGEDIVNGDLTIGDSRTFTLVTDGVTTEYKSNSALNIGAKANNIGTFIIEFDITAFGDDIYVLKDAARQTGTTTVGGVGVEYSFEKVQAGLYAAGDSFGSLSIKGAKQVGSFFRLSEGETYRATLEVTLDNESASAGAFNMQLEAVRYRIGSEAGTLSTITTDFADYETKNLYLND